jgi:hypothetical protein
MNTLQKFLTTMAAAALVTACGGGDENAGTPPFGNGADPACSAASATCATAANLTLVLDTASVQNTGAKVTVTATATTASGQALAGIPVSFSVDNGATFTQSSAATAADGTSVATVAIGADPSNRLITISATSGSLVATGTFAVSGSVLTATGSAVVVPSSADNQVIFRLTNANGAGIANQPITVVAGVLGTTTATTDVNGNYTYTYTAPAAGSIDIVGSAGGVSKTLTVLVGAGPGGIPPAVGPINSASVSANPSVVSTNSASTNNRAEIRALFVGPGNAAISGVRVRFDLNGDLNNIGGTFSTGSSIIYSDTSGTASTAYIPGAKASPTNGVTIRACYDVIDFAATACPNQATATITVVSDPLSVTIGSNDKVVIGPNDLTYIRKFVVLVVDASGKAKANVDVIPSIDLDLYWKGFYVRGASAWGQLTTNAPCVNEDINRNGVLEAVEDLNHSAAIEPRKSDVAVSILGTGKTDASGTATVQIEYPQNVATWARVKILVSATGVSGTEGRATWTETLSAPASAFTQTSAPAFIVSPYGATYFAMNPTTFTLPSAFVPTGYEDFFSGFPKATFPDLTPIPNATITDTCRNPY